MLFNSINWSDDFNRFIKEQINVLKSSIELDDEMTIDFDTAKVLIHYDEDLYLVLYFDVSVAGCRDEWVAGTIYKNDEWHELMFSPDIDELLLNA